MSAKPANEQQITEQEFYDLYKPDDIWLSAVQAEKFPKERVWTVIECDGRLYASAGWHYVNRLGDYVITEVPWVSGLETAELFDPEDDDLDGEELEDDEH